MKTARTLLTAGLALALAACAGPDRPRLLPPTTSITATSSAPPVGAADPARNLDPHFDVGQTISIGDSTVRPAWLVAKLGTPVRFRNDTAGTVEVTFVSPQGLASGPIPPGDSWAFDPQLQVAMTYGVSGATTAQGKIQVEPELSPGEKPWSPAPKER